MFEKSKSDRLLHGSSNGDDAGSVVTFGSQANSTKEIENDFQSFKQHILSGENQHLIKLEDQESQPEPHGAANGTTGEPSYELTPQTDRGHARALHNICPESFNIQS